MNIPAQFWQHHTAESKNTHSDEAMRPTPIEASSATGSGLDGHAAPPTRAHDATPPFAAKQAWRAFRGEERRQAQRRQRAQAVMLDTRIQERRMTEQAFARICCAI